MRKEVSFRERIVPWLFLAPSLIFVSIMVFIPLLDVLRRSFFQAAGGRFVGFENYLAVLDNSAFKLAAGNTLKFVLVCIPLLLVISLAVSLLLTAFRESHGIFKTSFLVPMAIPVASIVLLWRVIFHKNGLLNAFLSLWDAAPVDWIGSRAAFGMLVFAYVWKNFGYDMVLWLSGLGAINPALYEAAQIDGAGSIRAVYANYFAKPYAGFFHHYGAFAAELFQGIPGGISDCRKLSGGKHLYAAASVQQLVRQSGCG